MRQASTTSHLPCPGVLSKPRGTLTTPFTGAHATNGAHALPLPLTPQMRHVRFVVCGVVQNVDPSRPWAGETWGLRWGRDPPPPAYESSGAHCKRCTSGLSAAGFCKKGLSSDAPGLCQRTESLCPLCPSSESKYIVFAV